MKAYLSMLDNPIWNALTNNHQNFSAGTIEIKRYEKDTIPFMGMEGTDGKLLENIAPFFELNEEVFLKDDVHGIPDCWETLNKLNCLQMIYMPATFKTIDREGIIKLSAAEASELFELVNLVQPGFFKQKTSLLGDYYGIKKDGHLVAAAGERFKLKGFTELSAVCTHPEHTGNGYAQRLLNVLCSKNLEEGNTPFLHVVDSNTRAIKIYEHLDFKTRINFPLVKLKYLGRED
ncbi:GNAT superfamily N-acetyltransferase [Pedobacter cryoconitis]|uniref:GNAT superfamily N-acetyltransferase n=1 Tax=Pedobacter cryoconitis TaxID=188932 RepID=A0A7W8ZJH5_9SPHI|nr:GNAT family N-acetyltransferase [Pedobacter cryoconitis]MBB5635156.1 GNAT superfamily N-acetyltransferase [Pedobacter cryoconitis]MBB6271660.1 GNAT superfamily N-acetyltransferase [Pedobacter cryoconitis]